MACNRFSLRLLLFLAFLIFRFSACVFLRDFLRVLEDSEDGLTTALLSVLSIGGDSSDRSVLDVAGGEPGLPKDSENELPRFRLV